MDYFLTEEQQMIKDLARQVAEERLKPVRAEAVARVLRERAAQADGRARE